MVDYQWVVGDHTVGPEWPIEPQSPTLTFNLTGTPHQATCTVDGRSDGGRKLIEGVQDAWIYRDNQILFRGPFTDPSDTGDANQHTVDATFQSYRYRVAGLDTNLNASNGNQDASSYPVTGTNAPAAAWNLLAYHFGDTTRTDLASLIVNASDTGTPLTGTGRQIQYGVDLATAVDAIATAADASSFDWDLIPLGNGTIAFTTWSKAAGMRGTIRPDVLLESTENSGGNITWNRSQSLTGYGNRAYVQGTFTDVNGNTTVVIRASSVPYGAIGAYTVIDTMDDTTGYATLIDAQAAIQAKADSTLAAAQTLAPSYTVTTTPGWWQGPDHLWLGDTPTLRIRSGRLDVVEQLRVTQIQIQVADGAETVQFTLGTRLKPLSLAHTLAGMDRRIQFLLLHQ